jgi:hypothetical protein
MRKIAYQEFPSCRRFGVELEVSNNLTKSKIGKILKKFEANSEKSREVIVTPGLEGWAQTKGNDYWHVKFDRTCGPLGKNIDYGWEVASFIGSGTGDVNHISRLARELDAAGAEVNLNCGFHVHVEVKDYSPYDMGILLARWMKVEDLLFSICHKSRSNNEYCASIKSIFNKSWSSYTKDPEYLWDILRPYDLGTHNNNSKKVTLNTVGFATHILIQSFSRNTVELRMPECLLDETHVKNWIRLIVNFVDFSKSNPKMPDNFDSCNSIEELLVNLGLSGQDEFLIMDHDLLMTKIWLLKKIISCSRNELMIHQAKKTLEFVSEI